jgi:hypothetical protein
MVIHKRFNNQYARAAETVGRLEEELERERGGKGSTRRV